MQLTACTAPIPCHRATTVAMKRKARRSDIQIRRASSKRSTLALGGERARVVVGWPHNSNISPPMTTAKPSQRRIDVTEVLPYGERSKASIHGVSSDAMRCASLTECYTGSWLSLNSLSSQAWTLCRQKNG